MKSTILFFIFLSTFFKCNNHVPDTTIYKVVKEQSYVRKEWTSLKENGKLGEFFKRNGRIYCGEVMFNEYPLKDIDTASFMVIPESGYAKDKHHIYYPLGITCICGKNWGCCHCTEYITNADVNTFTPLGGLYGKDSRYVYFMGRRRESMEVDSFTVIHAMEKIFFGKDNKHIYNGDLVFEGADPSSFHYDSMSINNDPSKDHYVFSDKTRSWEYQNGLLIEMGGSIVRQYHYMNKRQAN
jgi:hypothetical protein